MDKNLLDIFGFDVDENVLYFSTMSVNGIFSMDVDSGNVKYMAMSEKYHLYDGYLYRHSKVYNGKIWFSPYAADEILVYDIALSSCEYISIPKITGHGRHAAKFGEWYDYGEWFILIPIEYPALLKVNKKNYEVIAIKWEEELFKQYPDFIKDNGFIRIADNYGIHNETMYLLAENMIIKYDMQTDFISISKINNEAKMYTGIARFGNGFALAERNYCEFLLWDEEKHQIEKKNYDLGYRGAKANDDSGPIWIFKVNEGIVIAQAKANYLILVKESDTICKIDLNIKKSEAKEFLYSQVKQKAEKLYFPLDGQNIVLIVNTDNWSQECIKMNLSDTDFSKIIAKIENEDRYVVENAAFYDLGNLLHYLTKNERQENLRINKKQDAIGTHIYKSVQNL